MNGEFESKVEAQLSTMRELELKLFVIEFNKAAQLDRSISKNSQKPMPGFRKELVNTCLTLMGKMDNDSLSNLEIRNRIDALSRKYAVSYGQAQKVVNVCLKQYMFLTRKYSCAQELDCPLDSTTMKGCKIKNKKMISVEADDYKSYQDSFEKENGLRIFKDEEYDKQRIENFFHGEKK